VVVEVEAERIGALTGPVPFWPPGATTRPAVGLAGLSSVSCAVEAVFRVEVVEEPWLSRLPAQQFAGAAQRRRPAGDWGRRRLSAAWLRWLR